MICRQMGGECDLEIKADTSEEMIEKMTAHVSEAHPEVASNMGKMTEEEHKEWETEFQKKWNEAPVV